MATEVIFLNPEETGGEGLITVGGNLSTEFLIAAYSHRIFTRINIGEPIL